MGAQDRRAGERGSEERTSGETERPVGESGEKVASFPVSASQRFFGKTWGLGSGAWERGY